MSPRATTNLGGGLFFLERGWLNGNHLVHASSPVTLIDTGYTRDFDDTRALIEGCGVGLDKVDHIVTTHCHCDHIGGHQKISKMSGRRRPCPAAPERIP